MTKTRGKKSKYTPTHSSIHSNPSNGHLHQVGDLPDSHLSSHVYFKDGSKTVPMKQSLSKSSLPLPSPHSQNAHPNDHSSCHNPEVSISSFFSDDDEEEFQYVSGIVGKSVEFEYNQPKPSLPTQNNQTPSSSSPQKQIPVADSIQPQQQLNDSKSTGSFNEDERRRTYPTLPSSSTHPSILNNSSAPPNQHPPPPSHLSEKISFQEFLQSKEVAKIHDTAKKFAQLRLQQLQNEHSTLTDEQRAQVHYFLENQHLLPVHSSNPTSSDPQQMASEQYAANVNAISSLATMAAAAALHNFEKKNGAVEFLSDSDAVAIANSIKLPLPPDELSNIANYPSLSNLSNMTVKEVNEWASRDIHDFTNGQPTTMNPPNGSTSQHHQNPHFKVPSAPSSLNTTVTSTTATPLPPHSLPASSSATADTLELTPEQKQFRQQVIQYDRQIQQMQQMEQHHHKQQLYPPASSSLHPQSHSQSGSPHRSSVHLSKQQQMINNGQSPSFSYDKFKSDKIWDTSNAGEKERIRQFWQGLSYEERRELVKIPKSTVMQKMKEQKRTNCNCLMCGKKRLAIEELESLYEAYSKSELEKLDKDNSLSKLQSDDSGNDKNDNNLNENKNTNDSELTGPEIALDENSSDKDLFNFGNTLTIQGGVLTVADDLLRNNGKKFIDMMDLLQQRRQRREEAEVQAMADYDADQIDDDEEDEFTEDDGKYEDDYEDYEGEESEEEYDEASETEEARWDASKRLLHKFAISIFEQRLMTAYREKVAQERQEKLLEELEEEKRLSQEREAKKIRDKEKKKERKRQQKLAKEEERMKKQAEIEREMEEAKERQRQKAEEARRKKLEQKKKKEAERQRQEEERLRKLEEERKKEQKRKEEEELKKRKEEEKQRKEEERLRKEKEIRMLQEQKEREKAEQLEREEQAKKQQLLLEAEETKRAEAELKKQADAERLENEKILKSQELEKQNEAERLAKEKEIEAIKVKHQHQQRILASLRQHVKELGTLKPVTVATSSPPLATANMSPSTHGFNASNSFPNDVSSAAFNPSLVSPMNLQFNQRHFTQPISDPSFYHTNGMNMMPQKPSDMPQFSSSTNAQSPSLLPSSSSSFNTRPPTGNSWNGSPMVPSNQNISFYQPASSISPVSNTDLLSNSTLNVQQQNILNRSSRSTSPPESNNSTNFTNKRTSAPNSNLKRMSMSSIDSITSYSPMNGFNGVNNGQLPHNNSTIGASSQVIPSKSFSGNDTLFSSNSFATADSLAPTHFRPFTAQPQSQQNQQQHYNNRPGSIFNLSGVNGTSYNSENGSAVSDGWNVSSVNQPISLTPRRGSLWTTGSGSTWGSSGSAELLSSSVPNSENTNQFPFAPSLTSISNTNNTSHSNGSLTGGSAGSSVFTGRSLLDKRLSTPAVSRDVIRASAIKAYHEYSSNFLFDGKVSCQLLYVNTLNKINASSTNANNAVSNSNVARFNQQEFFDACESPDDQGIVYFELIRNRMGLVTHLRYNISAVNNSLSSLPSSSPSSFSPNTIVDGSTILNHQSQQNAMTERGSMGGLGPIGSNVGVAHATNSLTSPSPIGNLLSPSQPLSQGHLHPQQPVGSHFSQSYVMPQGAVSDFSDRSFSSTS